MIVDSSAIVAILAGEDERARFIEAIVMASDSSISAATALETSIVLQRYGDGTVAAFDRFLIDARIAILPFDHAQLVVARAAYRRYGRGSGHPAKLNFGDCFSYAAAMVAQRPLLFKGTDFCRTDVLPAL